MRPALVRADVEFASSVAARVCAVPKAGRMTTVRIDIPDDQAAALEAKAAADGLSLEGWLQKVARQEATWNVCAHPRGRPTACSRSTVLALPMSPMSPTAS